MINYLIQTGELDTQEKLCCVGNCINWIREQSKVINYDWPPPYVLDLVPTVFDSDRTYFKYTEWLREFIQKLSAANIIDMCPEPSLRNLHGPTAVFTYREKRSRYAAQLTIHSNNLVEIDFDYWRPWDLVGLIGHGIEVISNRFRKTKTDPYKVAENRNWYWSNING